MFYSCCTVLYSKISCISFFYNFNLSINRLRKQPSAFVPGPLHSQAWFCGQGYSMVRWARLSNFSFTFPTFAVGQINSSSKIKNLANNNKDLHVIMCTHRKNSVSFACGGILSIQGIRKIWSLDLNSQLSEHHQWSSGSVTFVSKK